MIVKQSGTDLSDTALVVECTSCQSGWTIHPHTSHTFSAQRCPGCGMILTPETAAQIDQLISFYRALATNAGLPVRLKLIVTPKRESSVVVRRNL